MDATKQSVTVQCSLIVFTLEANIGQHVQHFNVLDMLCLSIVTPQSVADV